MADKLDRKGRPVYKGSRVKWVGRRIKYNAEDHYQGYKDVEPGARGTIVSFKSGSMALVRLDGHTKAVDLSLSGIEEII